MSHARQPAWLRLLREPVLHFFAIGAALFVIHGLIAGNPRKISTTPALEAELVRRFQDLNGRAPNPAERDAALSQWQRDEALFREALRDHLDRDDPMVRSALVDKMHARAAFEVPKHDPSDAELEQWRQTHRSLYETPLRYDFEFVALPKSDPSARAQLDQFERAVLGGANPATLGHSVQGGNLTATEMNDRIEPELAERLPSLPLGAWQRLESAQHLILARVLHVTGGLPPLAELRAQLLVDWSFADKQRATDLILQRIIDRYQFERQK